MKFISPQSERSELGAFYFCPGVLSGYCCVCESGYCCVWERGYCNCVCYRGSSEMSQIHVQWWHFLTAIGYCWFWCCFITKVWSVDNTIIVIYINGVCYKGSSEKWQIHTQWWYFSRLLVTVDSFDTKVWSVDQWKLVLAKSLFCSILNFGISCCIFEFCPYFRPYNARIFAKKLPVILQKWARMKN